MTDAGGINTCFLTTRLPLWAGVRQNVTGSNINGTPVTSGVYNQVTPRAASVVEERARVAAAAEVAAEARAQVAAVTAATLRAVEEETGVMEELRQLKQNLTEVEAKITKLSSSMTGLKTSLDSLQASARPAVEEETQ